MNHRTVLRMTGIAAVTAALLVAEPALPPEMGVGQGVVQGFTSQNLIVGTRGYDVDELQNRLHYLGYYNGKIDGQFGWLTYHAVRWFQSRFGLPVTGKVDFNTKQKLVEATKGWHYHGGHSSSAAHQKGRSGGSSGSTLTRTAGLSASDLNLMAHVVYGEARGESYEGEVAIAAVILNRLRSSKFPHSIPQIVYNPGSFTAVSDGQVNLQPDAQAKKAVMAAVHGWDPSLGALYYFNPATASNKWIWSRPEIITIGHHIFCR